MQQDLSQAGSLLLNQDMLYKALSLSAAILVYFLKKREVVVTVFNRLEGLGLSLMFVSTLTGCVSNPNSETWKLPKKDSPESAMIIGRIDMPSNKADNPDGKKLYLQAVNFMRYGEVYYFDGGGEKNHILHNNYFVVPNIKPGKYYFKGFLTAKGYNTLTDPSSVKKEDTFDVKPGEIKYVGSFDYIENKRSFSEKVKNAGTYQLRRAPHPTEHEMLQWLNRIGAGSGWESSIKTKLRY